MIYLAWIAFDRHMFPSSALLHYQPHALRCISVVHQHGTIWLTGSAVLPHWPYCMSKARVEAAPQDWQQGYLRQASFQHWQSFLERQGQQLGCWPGLHHPSLLWGPISLLRVSMLRRCVLLKWDSRLAAADRWSLFGGLLLIGNSCSASHTAATACLWH